MVIIKDVSNLYQNLGTPMCSRISFSFWTLLACACGFWVVGGFVGGCGKVAPIMGVVHKLPVTGLVQKSP